MFKVDSSSQGFVEAAVNTKGYYNIGDKEFSIKKHKDLLIGNAQIKMYRIYKSDGTVDKFEVWLSEDGAPYEKRYTVNLGAHGKPLEVRKDKSLYELYDVLLAQGQLSEELASLSKEVDAFQEEGQEIGILFSFL